MLREVKIESGWVRGIQGSDVRSTVFKGIPFAADPVGENRWRAPQPVEPWEGVRDCSRFAPITVQKIPGRDPNAFYSKEWHCDPEVPMSEAGSLCLNVWTPANSADEKLPVMVWIFGGGFQEGYCHEMEFDGESLNRRGVILVSIAYRLNVFGFLCHPDLRREDPEACANFGLLDQNYALQWVQRNIAAFGGDPDNVTIFGQSAGGGSTMYHVTSPKSAGLFKKAIAQSAGGIFPAYPKHAFMPIADTMEKAEEMGIEFVRDYLGCSNIAEARKLDAEFIEKKYEEFGKMMTAVIDRQFIVDQWYQRVLDDKTNDVQMMTGNTTNEFKSVPKGDVDEWIKAEFGPYAEKYAELCRAEAGDDEEAYRAAAGLVSFEVCAATMAEVFAKHGRPLYYYEFGPTIPGDNAGAFHSSELWFVFETLMKCWRPFDGHHYDLARQMCNYWTNFAKFGDPNGKDADGVPMPEWRKYTAEDRDIMFFFDKVVSSAAPLSEKKQFLNTINLKEYQY